MSGARPTLYTEELAEAICERLVGEESLRHICLDTEMPDKSTVFRWLAIHQEFATKYARARSIQAHHLEEDMGDIEDRTLSGEIDPRAANVVLGSKRWRAEKLAPKVYGPRLDLNHSGEVTVNGLAGRMRAKRSTGSEA